MTTATMPKAEPRGLSVLRTVALTPPHERLLATAVAHLAGPAPWQARKRAEARELLALAQTARRLSVLHLDLAADLRAVLGLKVTVPCRVHPGAPLRMMTAACLGLCYRQEAIVLPQPGSSFITILRPDNVWHGNVKYGEPQVLCLGPTLPAGVPVRELVLLAYGALTFQGVAAELDERNAAGVLNVDAAHDWQENIRLLPLSKEPFIQEAAS